MVDYEPTVERVVVNVVVLSADYYIVADDSTAVEFNFANLSLYNPVVRETTKDFKPIDIQSKIVQV